MKIRNYSILLLILACTGASSIAFSRLGANNGNILMIFMVGVLLVTALTNGYRFGIIASFISVLIFNFFFTVPLHTFAIYNSNDIALMFFFLIASIISSSLTARFQRQLMISRKNEQTAKLLYEVTQHLSNGTGEGNIVRQGIRYIKEHTGCDSIVELYAGSQTYSSDKFAPAEGDNFAELPITGIAIRLGTLKLYNSNRELDVEQKWLVDTVAAQMGIALDREFVYNEREKTRIAMEREHLKSNLLRSIGHDLRTPLAGIAGASSYIVQKSESLDRESIRHLAADINEQSVWLTNLVENILNMTRIENDRLQVNKQIEVVDDIVGEAITHVIGLKERPFSITLPQEVVTAPMDGKMIVQVLVNLLDNAVKHTPKGSPIELAVIQKEDTVEFNVGDSGSGLAEDPSSLDSIFEPFVTTGKTGADGKKGIGLGLAICKAVVKAHGGSITTGRSHLGGARFTVTLPCTEAE